MKNRNLYTITIFVVSVRWWNRIAARGAWVEDRTEATSLPLILQVKGRFGILHVHVSMAINSCKKGIVGANAFPFWSFNVMHPVIVHNGFFHAA